MEWKLADLEIDPEFEQQIPGLTSDEFNQLKRNILADGKILTPLIKESYIGAEAVPDRQTIQIREAVSWRK